MIEVSQEAPAMELVSPVSIVTESELSDRDGEGRVAQSVEFVQTEDEVGAEVLAQEVTVH